MPNDFYPTSGSEPSLHDQMDPLGTAGQHTFVADEPAPAASVKIGKTQTKKKMSIGKKIGYGVGALVAGFFGLVIVLDPGTPQGNPSPKPPAAAPGQMMGADAAAGATVMGSAPVPADAAAQAPAAAAPAPAAPDPASVAVLAPNSTPAPTAAAPAPAAAAAPAPAAPVPGATPAPAVQSVHTPAAAPTPVAEQVVLAKGPGKMQSTLKADAPAPNLAARVAHLERRLARYEHAEAQQRVREAKVAALRATAPAPKSGVAPSEKLVVTSQAAIEPRKPAVLSNDAVRVIGVSSRHGVTSALVDFGGAKHRVSPGESIPGLGAVQTVAVDAAGNPVVEINGVRYQ